MSRGALALFSQRTRVGSRPLRVRLRFLRMTRHDWKSCSSWSCSGRGLSRDFSKHRPCAALKRRFFTVVLAAGGSSVQSQEQDQHQRQTDRTSVPHGGVLKFLAGAGDGAGWYGVLRLRMASTSWASCFAQDDSSNATDRASLLAEGTVRPPQTTTPTAKAPGFARCAQGDMEYWAPEESFKFPC